ncbi:hypothetical protein EBB07_00055 [Paenibacillaceae bacterium]|nr:hypothetical protein EBB07_00055 [Paenibacillaceae bacterium]
MELHEYLQDPRTDCPRDSHRWQMIFRLTCQMVPNKLVAVRILKDLWAFRSFGLTMRRDHNGIKFAPTIRKGWAWETMEDYEDMRRRYLAPYTEEIKILVRKVEEETD